MTTIKAFNEISRAPAPYVDPSYQLGSTGLGQDFFGDMRIGDQSGGAVKIEGTRNRILISDDSNDRILIGYQKDGF